MAEVSVLSERISRLLHASRWKVHSRRSIIEATEPAFEPITRTWMAGAAWSLSEADIYAVGPSRLIVEDSTSDDQIVRLRAAMIALGNGGTVSTYSRFIDEFWGAGAAVEAAIKDAEESDSDLLFEAKAKNANDRHVMAHLDLGTMLVPDHRALESGLPEGGTCMAVLADAGLGKSELLRWHEWRYAVSYESALRSRKSIELPPVALRVPLRDFKSLSLDYVAHNLSQPAESGGRPALPRISSGSVLRELVVQRRLILFLDGLDEVSADSDTVDAGISEWRNVVRDGGSFVITSRDGHEASRGTIARRFNSEQIAYLRPLEGPAAHELLVKRGTAPSAADLVIKALTGPSAGIPLFLLLADHVGLDTKPPADRGGSRTLVMLDLLELFCERDEDRVGLPAADQIAVLTRIAEWTMEAGPKQQDELLKDLGIDQNDPLARVVRNPHALLIERDGRIEFKFAEFGALFTARAIAEAWQSFGFNSAVGLLRTHKLDELVVEYLARLLLPAKIGGAWVGSESDDRELMLRRNLLAIALARVADVAHGYSPNARSLELSKVLGNRSLAGLSLSGLYLDRFDFSDWQIQRIQGSGGVFSYCENLWKSEHDESVASVSVDGCSFDPPTTARVDLIKGSQRLRRLVQPLRRKNGGPVVAIMRRDEIVDRPGWELLGRLRLAEASGKASRARWTLNADGVRILTSFSMADGLGSDALATLIEQDQDVRALVTHLAK